MSNTRNSRTGSRKISASLSKGDVLSEQQFYVVEKVSKSDISLRTDAGEPIIVSTDYADSQLMSAKHFGEEKVMTKTEAAAFLLANSGVAMTVNFNKQVKEADVKKELVALYPNKGGRILSESDYTKRVSAILKTALEGEERTMVGRHYGELNDLGRVNFIDMEIAKDSTKANDNRLRLVDPRSINWLICRGVKVVVK